MTKGFSVINLVIYLSAFISMHFSVCIRGRHTLIKTLIYSLTLNDMTSNTNTGSTNQDDNRQQQGQGGNRDTGSQGNGMDSSK